MSFSTTDTIVAIATPQGRGGIGVVRVSGTDAVPVVKHLVAHERPLEPRRAHFTRVRCGPTSIDQAVVTFFPAPHSYTAEDVVEIAAHGSPVVLRAIVDAAIAAGARLAEPGEFTLRAYLNGRLDLMQAEAVADLIDAATPLQARAAFDQLEGTLTREIAAIDATLLDLIARLEASVDFPDEGYHFIEPQEIVRAIDGLTARTSNLLADAKRGRLIREGFQVAIVGRPNVGKSTLFNALVGAPRAIVTAVPGTTRDLVTETVDLMGLRVTLVDTAGIRDVDDVVEAEGVARSMNAVAVADLVLLVVDEDDPEMLRAELMRVSGRTVRSTLHLVVQSKSDLGRRTRGVSVSAVTGEGLDELRRAIVAAVADVEPLRDPPAITNTRHAVLLERAAEALARARRAAAPANGALSEEFVLIDLQDARAALEEITGRRTPNDVLAHIFERFCIGK
jgi:tRNA modification GTPase